MNQKYTFEYNLNYLYHFSNSMNCIKTFKTLVIFIPAKSTAVNHLKPTSKQVLVISLSPSNGSFSLSFSFTDGPGSGAASLDSFSVLAVGLLSSFTGGVSAGDEGCCTDL